jgi:hypothetical protein
MTKENGYAKGIKNPVLKFIYVLLRFRLKEVLALLLVTSICLNIIDVNITVIIRDYIVNAVKSFLE